MTNKTKGPRVDAMQLQNGIWVPRAVYEALREHVRPRLVHLRKVPRLKAKDMVAPAYYADLDPWTVGGCVSHAERHGELPLRFLGCPYCSVRFYGVT